MGFNVVDQMFNNKKNGQSSMMGRVGGIVLLGVQSHFGDKSLGIRVRYRFLQTAALKGLALGIWLGLGFRVMSWAVFDIFRLIILEAHVGPTKTPRFPNFMLHNNPEVRQSRLDLLPYALSSRGVLCLPINVRCFRTQLQAKPQ